jgi:hypothetical protein
VHELVNWLGTILEALPNADDRRRLCRQCLDDIAEALARSPAR